MQSIRLVQRYSSQHTVLRALSF